MIKVYLSGAVASDPNFLMKFQQHEVYILEELAHMNLPFRLPEIVNPAAVTQDMPDVIKQDWHACMRIVLAAMLDCTDIAMLPDWINSPGAQIELFVAGRCGIRIHKSCDDFLAFVEEEAVRFSGVKVNS